jgi:hypothetical protein
MTKSMTSRFPGTCNECQTRFSMGTKIVWDSISKLSVHANLNDCAQAKADAAAKAAASGPAPKLLGLDGIVTFITAAKERGLKFPKARFLAPGNFEMRLYIAGPQSKNVGGINVKIDRDWLGVVLPDGTVKGSLKSETAILETLKRIASDPAKAASEYGALMGRCSFCNLPLTDAGSVEVGYGPICASRFGLPHTPKGTPGLAPIPSLRSEEMEAR